MCPSVTHHVPLQWTTNSKGTLQDMLNYLQSITIKISSSIVSSCKDDDFPHFVIGMSINLFKRWLDMLWSFCNRKGWLFLIDSVHCRIFICCHDLAKIPFCDWGQTTEKHEYQLSITNYIKVNYQFYTLRVWQNIKSLKRGSRSTTVTQWKKG